MVYCAELIFRKFRSGFWHRRTDKIKALLTHSGYLARPIRQNRSYDNYLDLRRLAGYHDASRYNLIMRRGNHEHKAREVFLPGR